jgi:hypothetical protein
VKESFPTDPTDALIESAYTEVVAEAKHKVDAVFRELGARVIFGITSDDGVSEVRLYIAPEPQSESARQFANRPA